jgi:phage-related protein
MPADDEIEIRAILTDEFSRPADRVIAQEERMEQATRDLSGATDELSGSQDRNTRATDENATSQQRNSRQRTENSRRTRESTQDTDRSTDSTRRNSRETDRNSRSLGNIIKSFGKLGKLLKLFKIAIMIDGIAKAMAGAGALGAIAAVGIGQAGAILAGALLPLPALIGGAALAMATLKIGFGGIGEALSAYDPNDLTAFNEAIKDMGPNGQATARALGEIKKNFEPIKKMVQENLLSDMAGPLKTMGESYLPVLQGALLATSDRLKETIGIGMGFLNLPSTVEAIGNILENASKMAYQMGHAFNGALRGTISMFSAVDGVAVLMMEDIAYGINHLADLISLNGEAIGGFAMNGYNGIKYMLGVVWDLGGAFVNIFKGAGDLFGGFGTRFHDMAARFKEWTGSVEGQAKIKQFFDQLKPILEALVGLGVEVAKAIGRIAGDNMGTLVPMIDKFKEMIPSIERIVTSASGAAPAFLDIAQAILEIVGGTEALTPTAAILGMAAPIMTQLAEVITSLPQPIQTAIGWMVTFGLAAKAMAGTALGQMVIGAIKSTRAYQFLATTLRVNIALMKWYLKAQLQAAFTAMATGIRAAATASWAFTSSLLANPITWIVIAVIALIAAFVILWMKCEAFRNVIKSIGQWFVDVWNNTINPLVQKTWQWMQEAWDKVLNIVRTVVSAVVNFFVSAWNTIKPVVMTVISIFTTVFNVVKTIVMTYIGIVVTIFTTYFNVIKAVVTGVISFIGPIFMGFVGIVRAAIGLIVNIFQLGWNIVRLVVNVAIAIILLTIQSIWTRVQAIMNIVMAVFRVAWSIVTAIVGFAIDWIVGKVNAIVAVVQAVTGFLAPFFQAAWTIITTIVGIAVDWVTNKINTIIGFVSAVMGAVQGFFSSAWGIVTGIVGGAIDMIGGVIGSIAQKVSGPLETVKSIFTRVFGAIRDFVMGIIDRITSAIDGISSVVSSISSGISGLADALPGLATGGPVTGGMKAMVGEVGPEAFVTKTGQVKAIGTGGPEIRKFTQPGYVVPNHVLAGKRDSSVPNRVMGQLQGALAGANAATPKARPGTGSTDSYMSGGGGGDHFDFSGAVFGEGMDEAKVKRAVKSAIAEADRNRRERG